MKINIPYVPGQKVRLISGNEFWIKCINIYDKELGIALWDGCKDTIYVEPWQIASIIEGRSIGYNITLGKK